jgi:D-arabinose 1-dehydrogenase-like Zn-dependent alcohol dehydrogenase
VGDRLTFSIADSCGICEFCYKGLNQKCVKLFKVIHPRYSLIIDERVCSTIQYGHAKLSDGSGYNGCYATHIILRRGTHVVKLPDSISDRCAAPINCSLATAMCAMEYVPKINNGRAFVQVNLLSNRMSTTHASYQ